MDLTWIFRLIALTGLVFVMLPAAAADLPPLNCSVKRLPSCYFRYQLSQWTGSADCDTQWEDHSKVVIAQGPLFNKSLVENLTDDHIDLKICQHQLRHRTDCLEADRIVDCRANCLLFELDDCPPTTKFCLSESVCVDRLTGGLSLGVPVGLLLLALIIWWAVLKYKRRRYAAAAMSYEAPTEQVQIQKQLQTT